MASLGHWALGRLSGWLARLGELAVPEASRDWPAGEQWLSGPMDLRPPGMGASLDTGLPPADAEAGEGDAEGEGEEGSGTNR